MEKRNLGKTGLELTLMGMGGFHFIETPKKEVELLLNTYLDKGGNYIETAADYGDGLSEQKVGLSVAHRRKDFILTSKCMQRTEEGATESLNRSLKYLKTDYLDLFFMHAVQSKAEVDQIHSADGAFQAALAAQKEGKIRFIAISGHGQPDALEYAINQADYDVLMTGFNYYDRFNFPTAEGSLLQTCLKKNMGVLGMKALADGYLFKSFETAIRYTLSLPIASLVLGANTLEYLEQDLKVINDFKPLSETEKEALYFKAPELGDYVCRQCGKCDEENGFKPSELFLLEGIFDRQMDNGKVENPESFALRERLKHWFFQEEIALQKYQKLSPKVNPDKDYSALNSTCPYGIDVNKKIKLAHSKLSQKRFIF
ncbi:MAG: aldo/keto reductase [Deltaproteobacteria bacterium]|jgi:uncharacterized protein|nr:aldo/keto reductase [Deltaproteobacteria bacterium]MBT4527421.1 aldo/keto reductase [Deltaproteobacteria bacterium]